MSDDDTRGRVVITEGMRRHLRDTGDGTRTSRTIAVLWAVGALLLATDGGPILPRAATLAIGLGAASLWFFLPHRLNRPHLDRGRRRIALVAEAAAVAVGAALFARGVLDGRWVYATGAAVALAGWLILTRADLRALVKR